MSPGPSTETPNLYAKLGRRFYAFRLDFFICTGVFLVGILAAGILAENYPAGRIAAFGLILVFLLIYEPLMVARYGGTFGHQKANIRITRAGTNANLTLWRATVRSLVKQSFGLLSFFFMFLTQRGQGLHDLVAGATVTIRDPLAASPGDCFQPLKQPPGQPASLIRRLLITALYQLLLFLFVILAAIVALRSASPTGSGGQHSVELITSPLGTAWLTLIIALLILGWTGRLPGARPGE